MRKSAKSNLALAAFIVFVFTVDLVFLPSVGGLKGISHFSLWLNGHTLPLDLATRRPPENEKAIAGGRVIYETRCARCHGIMGDGRGGRADELDIKPTDFTSGIYKFRSTIGLLPTDLDIFKTISRGVHGTAMLPWPALDTTEKWYVTYYIKTFSDMFEDHEDRDIFHFPLPDKPEETYLKLGRKVYEKAQCAECHGDNLDGNGPKAAKLKDDRGRPIRPRDFRNELLKRGTEIGDIVYTIAVGINGTPMKGYAGPLSKKYILALAHYIHSASKKPRGRGIIKGLLEMRPEEEKGIFIDHVLMPTAYRVKWFQWMFPKGG